MSNTTVKPSIAKKLTDTQLLFVSKAVQRKQLFLMLSGVGVAVGALLAIYYVWQWTSDPTFSPALPFVVVILVLLNARQNLRQHKYAKAIEALLREP